MTATCRSEEARAVRERVSALEAAEHYGFTPSRAGYICCPFHQERTASLKLYGGDGGWHCFGCGAGGSVIDFVMRLFDLDFRQAVVRLDMDFSLGLTAGRRPPPQQRSQALEARRRDRQKRDALLEEIGELTKLHREMHADMKLYPPSAPDIEALHPRFVRALKELPAVQWRLEELENELWGLEHGRKTA